jgi:hypothetical protein
MKQIIEEVKTAKSIVIVVVHYHLACRSVRVKHQTNAARLVNVPSEVARFSNISSLHASAGSQPH